MATYDSCKHLATEKRGTRTPGLLRAEILEIFAEAARLGRERVPIEARVRAIELYHIEQRRKPAYVHVRRSVHDRRQREPYLPPLVAITKSTCGHCGFTIEARTLPGLPTSYVHVGFTRTEMKRVYRCPTYNNKRVENHSNP